MITEFLTEKSLAIFRASLNTVKTRLLIRTKSFSLLFFYCFRHYYFSNVLYTCTAMELFVLFSVNWSTIQSLSSLLRYNIFLAFFYSFYFFCVKYERTQYYTFLKLVVGVNWSKIQSLPLLLRFDIFLDFWDSIELWVCWNDSLYILFSIKYVRTQYYTVLDIVFDVNWSTIQLLSSLLYDAIFFSHFWGTIQSWLKLFALVFLRISSICERDIILYLS